MLHNYLKIAWRNLVRNRSYAIINIVGLAIGLACFMFIMMYVQDETGYDRFHQDGDRIYRVGLERNYPGRSRNYAIIPPSYAEAMRKEFPEVVSTCRLFFFQGNNFMMKVDDQLYEEDQYMWADSTFFDFFGIPLLAGDRATALTKPDHVVLTESLARKLFGERDPVGEVIDIPNNDDDLVVSGVCADVPRKSHLRFNMLGSSVSLGFLEQPNYINFSAYTYLKLAPSADPGVLEDKFPDMVVKYASGPIQRHFGINYEEYQRQGNGYRYFLQPLHDIYLKSNLESEIKPPGSAERVRFFLLIALLIIGIASINFMNLATARSSGRAREVGIRKTLGSDRAQIAAQFLTEAVIISLVAGLIAMGINYLALPFFNAVTGKAFTASHLLSGSYVGLLLLAALITGLLSGAYPAFALSAFRPVQVLRSKVMQTTKGAGLRNALVVFQFGISVFLIISTILVYKQWRFTQNKDLGFNKEYLVTLEGAGGMTPQESETFKQEIRQLAGVTAVSGCSTQPGQQFFGMSFRPQGTNEAIIGSGILVDDGYIECMDMQLVSGRSFSEDFSDTLSILVNEAAVREMEIDDPIGVQVASPDNFLNPNPDEPSWYTIVGVVQDYHFQSLHHEISPLFFIHNQRGFNPGVDNLITVRMQSGAITSTLQDIEGIWKRFEPEQPFHYAFLDEEWASLYANELTTRRLSSLFSMIAIFIACLGLLALAAFTAERRTKEIGIRKVLGASVGNIVSLLSLDFLKLVLLGIVIATPVAWYVMSNWLENFAYRVDMGWGIFLLAASLAIAIAFLTVSYQSIRAALTNPVKSLRSE
ncbi:MAG: FtsX-like permease family protein [Saprospiraceae bacterium]|nr:FtsX-like permease family protein [Saprospiraceae bacterium]